MSWKIEHGDCLDVLRGMPAESVQCCVTSPPYWGLRDYGVAGQLGLERTPEEYIAKMVDVFREVRRVLRNDGTLWLNIGDSYNTKPHGDGATVDPKWPSARDRSEGNRANRVIQAGMKPKDLVGIPWMLAFALRADGWYLRQDIIWAKPNPMPESVRDRCTKSHEYIFLLSKSERYYYDTDAIAEPLADSSYDRLAQDVESQAGSPVPGKSNGNMKAALPRNYKGSLPGRNGGPGQDRRSKNDRSEQRTKVDLNRNWDAAEADGTASSLRNKRSVWNVSTKPYPEAHFATFPPEIPEICIKAGTKEGDTVLDPFNGAGTTGLVATRLMRSYVGIELNPEYVTMAQNRIEQDAPLFNTHTADIPLAGQGPVERDPAERCVVPERNME